MQKKMWINVEDELPQVNLEFPVKYIHNDRERYPDTIHGEAKYNGKNWIEKKYQGIGWKLNKEDLTVVEWKKPDIDQTVVGI